jgi:hypothetical protein
VCPWPDQGLEVTGHGHGDETDSDGPGFCCFVGCELCYSFLGGGGEDIPFFAMGM